MKRIVSIQDISDIGKCSLTAALPVISAMGVECAVLPTAVLSAHSQFEGFTFRDLTDEMTATSAHWKRLGLRFDAVYTGYLGSPRQVDVVRRFFDDFGKDAKIIVDPAMADFGRLYSGFDADFPREMARLCQGADIILPNITEACLLLGAEYREEYDREYIRSLLRGLAQLGASVCAITGVSFDEDKLGVVSYNSVSGEYFSYFRERCPGVFHGTGDLFASTVAGAVVNGRSIPDALALAADYTLECIKYTIADKNANWYGVNFEQAIPYLIRRLGK